MVIILYHFFNNANEDIKGYNERIVRYKIYTKTEMAWDAMFSAIRQAKSSIFLEMYIFADDTADTHDFVEILSQKALSGLKVKVIFDAFGSEVTNDSVKKLKDAGVELFFFRTLFRTNHRKILVIDEEISFVGGANIYKFFKRWDDLMVKLDGKVVTFILRSFARVYKSLGGKDPFVLKYDKELGASKSKGKVWFFEHFPPKNSFRLHKYYRDKIDFAKEKIMITTPYFMPNRWLVKALKKASKRGVEVEILIPRYALHPKASNIPNYFYIHKLYKHGIKFFLTKEMNHSKIMLVDGREGILGSQNMDILSFDFDMESGVFFSEPSLIKELSSVIEEWKRDSVTYHPKMRDTHLLDHFLEFCFGSFEYAVKIFNRLTKIF